MDGTGKGRKKEWIFLFTIINLVIMLAAGQLLPFTGKPVFEEPRVLSREQGGTARDVNMELMECLIQKGFLSDYKAEFYKTFELKKE